MRQPFQFITDGVSAFINVEDMSSREGQLVMITVKGQIMDSEALRSGARFFMRLANEMDSKDRPPTLGPQHLQIIKHITEKGSISNVEAQAVYRIRSLPRRIKDLKELGYKIKTELKKDPTGQRYARYSFA